MLARLPDRASFSAVVEYQLVGLLVVFTALISIWILLEIVGSFFKRQAANAPKPVAVSRNWVNPIDQSTALPATTIAAIAAAVHIAIGGQPHRITSIAPAAGSPNWASEGRRELSSSHRVR
jgi:hypothetical protein